MRLKRNFDAAPMSVGGVDRARSIRHLLGDGDLRATYFADAGVLAGAEAPEQVGGRRRRLLAPQRAAKVRAEAVHRRRHRRLAPVRRAVTLAALRRLELQLLRRSAIQTMKPSVHSLNT